MLQVCFVARSRTPNEPCAVVLRAVVDNPLAGAIIGTYWADESAPCHRNARADLRTGVAFSPNSTCLHPTSVCALHGPLTP